MKRMLILALLGLFVMTAGAAWSVNLISNGGFESPTLTDGALSGGPGTVSGWPFYHPTQAIYNPSGDGTAEGMPVEEGSNYYRVIGDAGIPWSDTRTMWYAATTIKANHSYTLRFKYGKSSLAGTTWTRNTIMFGGSPNGYNFAAGSTLWNNGYLWNAGAPGWRTWEMTHTVMPGDPAVGQYVGFYLSSDTWATTDRYYYDQFEVIESPLFPSSITYQGKLTNAQWGTIADVPHDFVFKFYSDETGGTVNWTSATMSITPTAGRFNAQIDNIDTAAAFPNGDVWMEMVVSGQTLSPRIKVNSVPFAMVAGTTQQ